MSTARAALESLLRTRKLDVTLTSGRRGADPAATGWAALDAPLGGGLPRGHLSEIVGPRSSGRTALFCRMAAAAAARGEVVALIDPHDRFDPVSAAAAGVDPSRLLWVRDTGDHERALKALHLVLQAGGFGLAAIDLTDVRAVALRGVPHTTWMRMARAVEGSTTVALVLAAEHVARSAGGVTIALENARGCPGVWAGNAARDRRLAGLSIEPRVIGAGRR